MFVRAMKDRVLARKLCSVDDMIQFILQACPEIDAERVLCVIVCMSIRS